MVLACAAAVLGLAGCGSKDARDLPAAATTPGSPSATVAPEGTVAPVGPRPDGIVADGASGLAAVALGGRPELVLADVDDGRVVRRVPLSGPARTVALARPGSPDARAVVPDEAHGTVSTYALGGRADGERVRVGTRLAVARVAPGPLRATALSDASGELAVVSARDAMLRVVRGDRVVRSARVGLGPSDVTTFADGRIIAVVAAKERVLQLYDATTLRRLASEPAGVGPTTVACRRGGLCYVADTTGRSVLVFLWEGGELDLTRRQFLPGEPDALAIDELRGRLWVTMPGRNEVVDLIAGRKTKPLRTVATVGGPRGVAVDASDGHVLVTGLQGGVLQSVPALVGRRR